MTDGQTAAPRFDDTLADREEGKVEEWAPNDPGATAYLIEHDAPAR